MKNFLLNSAAQHLSGLCIVRAPTGTGKSYNIRETIAQLLSDPDDKRKIIYLTSLKKNLPKSLEGSRDVLILRSNLDQVTEILPTLDVPEEFKTEAYIRTIGLVRKLKSLKAHDHDKEYINSVEKELMECEPAFRKELKSFLKNAYPTKEQRLNAIMTDKDLRWIGKLYPAVFTDTKRVLVMTVKKFLGKNSVIIDNSYDFLTSSMTENAIIFIDEFDSTKAVMRDHIIESALSVSNDYLSLFKTVQHGLDTANMSADLQSSLKQVTGLYDRITELVRNGGELIQAYHLGLSYKMDSESADRHQNFLFNDGSFHTILEKGRHFIRTTHNARQNSVTISSETRDEYYSRRSDEDISIYSMLRDIRSFLSRARLLIYSWAKSYQAVINSRRMAEQDEFTIENAVSTILNRIGLNSTQKQLLMNECCHISGSRRNVLPERSHHTDGFAIFEFTDSDEHNESTDINYIKVYDTPEKILRYISERSLVFAVSATADLPTVFGNYDLAYLKDTLGELYHGQDKDLTARVLGEIKEHQHAYNDGSIKLHTEIINTSFKGDADICKLCGTFMSRENARLAAEIISNSVKDLYAAVRYCGLLKVMRSFFEHDDIHALLAMQNPLPSENINMNVELLDTLFKLAASDAGKAAKEGELCALRTDNFDEDKKAILCALSNGERRFVMSSYSTIGAGQNLQYPVKDKSGYVELCECTNKDDDRRFYADFDAIYLGSITNLVVNTYSDGRISKEELFKMLFQVEDLYCGGELSYNSTNQMIRLAFNKYSGTFVEYPNRNLGN